MVSAILPFLLAGLLSTVVTAAILRWCPQLAEDVANERSLHVGIIPRIGGIGIVAAVFASLWYWPLSLGWASWAGLLVIASVSFLDDRYGLSIYLRLSVHIAVVAWMLGAMGPGSGVMWVAACLAWVWLINLFNFMDGADGLAGGMAAIAFAALASAAGMAGAWDLTLFSLAVTGAALGFLYFNLPPARVFLGDTGSISLGFLFGLLAWMGWGRGLWPWWFPAFVILPFLLDATLTLLGRMVLRQAFWRPHREHGYQKLVRMGWDRRRLLAWAYPLMLLDALLSIAALPNVAAVPWWSLAIVAAANVGIRCEIERRWQRFMCHAMV